MILPKHCYLRIRAIADQAVTVKARLIIRRSDGSVFHKHLTASTLAADSEQVTDDTGLLGAGIITHATLYHDQDSSYIRPSQIYAVLDLVVTDQTGGTTLGHHIICGGHLGGGKFLSRGFYEPPQPHYRTIKPASPAAGANLSYTLPDALTLESLTSLYFQYVADANAANRNVQIIGDDGAAVLWHNFYTTAITASQTRQLNMGASPVQAIAGGGNTQVTLAANMGLTVPNAGRIRTDVSAIQVGDQISAVAITGKWRWIMETLA